MKVYTSSGLKKAISSIGLSYQDVANGAVGFVSPSDNRRYSARQVELMCAGKVVAQPVSDYVRFKVKMFRAGEPVIGLTKSAKQHK